VNRKLAAIYKESVGELSQIYDPQEAESIINILFTDYLNISRISRLTNPKMELSKSQLEQLGDALARLKNYTPVQHVIGFSWFLERKFHVNEHTLIPRPETEELVDLIIKENLNRQNLQVLDVGTGTGCIAISLALGLPSASVSAWDISDDALKMAQANAQTLGASINFFQKDALNESPDTKLDIIVSNPPYIPDHELNSMHQNVTQHEPETSLFVPNDDPLLFYRRIAETGLEWLNENGLLYFEIHENYGSQMLELIQGLGYQNVQIFTDLNGKDRMLRAEWNPLR